MRGLWYTCMWYVCGVEHVYLWVLYVCMCAYMHGVYGVCRCVCVCGVCVVCVCAHVSVGCAGVCMCMWCMRSYVRGVWGLQVCVHVLYVCAYMCSICGVCRYVFVCVWCMWCACVHMCMAPMGRAGVQNESAVLLERVREDRCYPGLMVGALQTHAELPITRPEEGTPVEAWVHGMGTRPGTALSPCLESLKAEPGLTR